MKIIWYKILIPNPSDEEICTLGGWEKQVGWVRRLPQTGEWYAQCEKIEGCKGECNCPDCHALGLENLGLHQTKEAAKAAVEAFVKKEYGDGESV